MKRFFALIYILLSLCCVAYAEGKPTVKAYMERDSVMIGDVATLVVEVEQDVMQAIAFPEYDFSTNESVESAGTPSLDTLARDGRRMTIRRRYPIRSFDAGRYNFGIASVLYAERNEVDTLYTKDSLLLEVGTFLIDSTARGILDMKAQRELPFVFAEITGYMKWGLLIVLVTLLLAYVVLKIMARYGYSTFGLFSVPPPIPPHVTAFKALESLREKKLWQEGEYKGYYSALTDIIRGYISGRFGIAALEMTSDEIIAALRGLEDVPSRCELDMQELLRDADLVKFAKAEFSATQNEEYFAAARAFVELTMEQEEEQLQEEVQEEKVQEIEQEQGEEGKDEE